MARAITLIELLVAVSLLFLVVVSAGGLYAAAIGFFTTFNTQAEMQNQANIALENMIKDIYPAEDIEWINSYTIEITPTTGTPFRYYQEGSYIKRDTEIIARGVRELNFSGLIINPDTQRKTLQIDLLMAGRGQLKDLEFVTKVTLRKYE